MKFFEKLENSIAVVLLIAFFLPWISSFGFVNISAFQIPGAIKGFGEAVALFSEQQEPVPSVAYLSYVLYLIPICSIGTLIGSVMNKDTKISSGIAGSIIFVALAYIYIDDGIPDFNGNIIANIGIGLWLTFIGSLAMILCVLGVLDRCNLLFNFQENKGKQPKNLIGTKVLDSQSFDSLFDSNSELRCPSCNKRYDASYKFCPECGQELEIDKAFCPTCKGEIDSSLAFCPHCGYCLKDNNDRAFEDTTNKGNNNNSEEADKKSVAEEETPVTTIIEDNVVKKSNTKFSFSKSWSLIIGIGVILLLVILIVNAQSGSNTFGKKETTPIEYFDYSTGYATVHGIKPTDVEKAILWLNRFPLEQNDEGLTTVNEYVFSRIIEEGGARYHLGWYAMRLDATHFLVGYIYNPLNQEPGTHSYKPFIVAENGKVFFKSGEDTDNQKNNFLSLDVYSDYLISGVPGILLLGIDNPENIQIKSTKLYDLFKLTEKSQHKQYDTGAIKLDFDYPNVATSAFRQIALSPMEVYAKFGPPKNQSNTGWEYDDM